MYSIRTVYIYIIYTVRLCISKLLNSNEKYIKIYIYLSYIIMPFIIKLKIYY